MTTKESRYKSNFMVVGSNFNSSYYNTQAQKCLVNLNFNSKGRFSEFFCKVVFPTKWENLQRKSLAKWKKKKEKPSLIHEILKYICWKPLKLSQKYLENLQLEIQHDPGNKNQIIFFKKISLHLSKFAAFGP